MLLGLPPDPSRLDIYNDLDGSLTNLFMCVKERPIALIDELGFFPIHSRMEFDHLKLFADHKRIRFENIDFDLQLLRDRGKFTGQQEEEIKEILEKRKLAFDVELAAATYHGIRGSFSGTRTSFGVKKYCVDHFFCLIQKVGDRMKDVVIENKPAYQLIRERDGPGTFFYLDPPYVSTENAYQVVDAAGRKMSFHEQLCQVVQQCVGKVAISYNDCEEIRNLYRDSCFLLAFSRANPLAHQKESEFGELIITNYDPRPYMKKQVSLFDAPEDKFQMELVNIPAHPIKI